MATALIMSKGVEMARGRNMPYLCILFPTMRYASKEIRTWFVIYDDVEKLCVLCLNLPQAHRIGLSPWGRWEHDARNFDE